MQLSSGKSRFFFIILRPQITASTDIRTDGRTYRQTFYIHHCHNGITGFKGFHITWNAEEHVFDRTRSPKFFVSHMDCANCQNTLGTEKKSRKYCKTVLWGHFSLSVSKSNFVIFP
jgi:hypothetical protein